MQYIHGHLWCITKDVSIPQAVWIACNIKGCTLLLLRCRCFNTASGMDCMQYLDRQAMFLIEHCFNTASGMDCMQFEAGGLFPVKTWVSIPQAVWIACNCRDHLRIEECAARFNTASGMDCMQSRVRRRDGDSHAVSIPQAVWIACNCAGWGSMSTNAAVSIPQAVWIACNEVRCGNKFGASLFQYRKRYGLHAIGRGSR